MLAVEHGRVVILGVVAVCVEEFPVDAWLGVCAGEGAAGLVDEAGGGVAAEDVGKVETVAEEGDAGGGKG